MIKNLHINNYRKLKDITFHFSENINIISGTNGTCKTSLLHIIGNSFQKVTKTCDWLNDNNCMTIINQINGTMNPKLETLTRESKNYRDPAINTKGAIYNVEYFNGECLDFRKHNSDISKRYSVKLKYPMGKKQSLPCMPIIYLGIKRLFPFGEFTEDENIVSINKKLPQMYLDEISKLYKEFTHIEIDIKSHEKMGNIKNRADFTSNIAGVDSNTISAGEDNLYIILTALVSLKYYCENVNDNINNRSLFLIDEFDATLHPGLQVKLLKTIIEYSSQYNIQVIFTSHSLSLLEFAFKHKINVIYLHDNETSVVQMPNPNIYKIQMFLKEKSRDELYFNRKIPIFTEDDEARYLLKILFDYYNAIYEDFAKVSNYLYFVNANIGSENLVNIFNDVNLKITTGLICILDGDKDSDYTNRIITLPGNKSPENFIEEYAEKIYKEDSKFWINDSVLDEGYNKKYYLDNFKKDFDEKKNLLESLKKEKKSTHGVERDKNKKIFNKYKKFIKLVFEDWITNPENNAEVYNFYKDLNVMFKQVSDVNGIDSKIWTVD